MSTNHRALTFALAGAILSTVTVASAHAGELRVDADVISVEPIPGPGIEVEECAEKSMASLAQALAWDLGRNCTTRTVPSNEVSGYRVYYRWDNRVYNQVMAEPPGETIGLRVRLD